MHNPLVSVIIPVYNAENTIERAIISVLENDYSNIEIICIDDGSTDNSLQKIQQLAALNSNIKYFNQANSGVSIARNLGLQKACGKYVMFVDADDMIKRNTISVCIDHLEQKDADIICFNMVENRNGIEKRMLKNNYFNDYLNILYAADYPYAVNFTNAAISIIKKEFIDKYRISFVPNHIYEDWIFMINIFTKNPYCVFLNEDFYVYCRNNPISITSCINNKSLDIFDSYVQADKLIFSNLLNPNWLYINDRKFIYETTYFFVNKVIKSKNKEIIEKFYTQMQKYVNDFNRVYLECLISDIIAENNVNVLLVLECILKNKKVSFNKIKSLKYKKLLVEHFLQTCWCFISFIYYSLRGSIND